jgi:thiamine biosynthesis lipoprotein
VTWPVVVRHEVVMGTMVTLEITGPAAAERPDDAGAAADVALAWFRQVESACTRFNPNSELMRLCRTPGQPAGVSALLFEAVQFALAVAEETNGAFDPTVGHAMETRGFNREYSSGHVQRTDLPERPSGHVSYRDVELDPERQTIMLRAPMVLDLGAVAKGLAIDAAAKTLQEFGHFAIDAGGDLYLGGRNPAGEAWSVGIRHPRLHDAVIETIRVSDTAVCTSGDYERAGPGGEPHILDPRQPLAATRAASATVVAPTAMLADALATAAFVLGPDDGIGLLERQGVDGLIFSASLERRTTQAFTYA